MLKYLKQRFPVLLITFLAVTYISESCISDKNYLKTEANADNSLVFNWFYDYRKASEQLPLIKSRKPEYNFMQAEYYYLKGEDSLAFQSLRDVFRMADYRYVKASVNLMHSMYLTFDDINDFIDIERASSDIDAGIAFNMERVLWAVNMGEYKKAEEISINIPMLREMLVYSDFSAGFVSLDKDSLLETALKENRIDNMQLRKIKIPATDVSVEVNNYFSPANNRKFVFYNSFDTAHDGSYFINVDSGGLFKFVIDGETIPLQKGKTVKLDLTKGVHSFYVAFAPYQEGDMSFTLLFYDEKGRLPNFYNVVKKYTGKASVVKNDLIKEETLFDRYISLLLEEDSSQDDWESFYFKVSGTKSLPVLYHLGKSFLKEKTSEDYISFVKSVYNLYPDLGSRIEDEIFSYYYNIDSIDQMRLIYEKRKNIKEKSFSDYLIINDYNYKIKNYGPLVKFSEELISKYSDYSISYIYAAEACEAVNNVDCEISYLEELFRKRPAFYLVLDKLNSLYNQSGRFSDAEKVFNERMLKKSDSVNGLLYGANLSFAVKDYEKALLYAKKALQINPEHTEITKIIADIYVALGDYKSASEYFEKAYSMNPSDNETALKLSDIRNTEEDSFLKENSISDEESFKIIKSFRDLNKNDNSAFSVVIDSGSIHFFSASYGVIRSRYAVRINNDEGSRAFSSFRKSGRIITSRIIRENGEVESTVKSDSDFIYPELKKGDVFDIVYDSELFADSWHDGVAGGWFFASDSSYVFKSSVVISVPLSVNFHYDLNSKSIFHEHRSEKLANIYSFKAEDILMPPEEKNMDVETNIYPYLAYSCNGSWEEFAALQASFIKSQQSGGDIIRNKALSIADSADDPLLKIEMLRNFVARDISYFFNDKGIFKIKPEKTSDTLKNMRGDCKDKAIILKELLAALGIKSNYSLVKSRSRGKVYKKLPFMQFDHAVVYIPAQEGIDKGFFIDPVASYDNFMLINSEIEDTDAFVVNENDLSYSFVKVQNNVPNRINFLQTDKQMWHIEFYGASASTMRYNFMKTGDFTWFEEILSRLSPGIAVKHDNINVLTKGYEEPFVIEIEFAGKFNPEPVSFFFEPFMSSGKRNYDFYGYDRLGWFIFNYKTGYPDFYETEVNNDIVEYKSKKSGDSGLLEFRVKKGYLENNEFNTAVESVLNIIQHEKGADNG